MKYSNSAALAAKPAVLPEVPKFTVAAVASAPVELVYTGRVSPLVKKLVALNNVDINLVHGTGQDGRITKEDVLNYLETRKAVPPTAIAQPLEAAVAPDSAACCKTGVSGRGIDSTYPHAKAYR